MTSREFIRLILRRWYVVLLGVAITLAISWPMTHRPGVYFSQFNVVLLPPTYQFFPNKYEDPQYRLAPLAGVLVSDWNGDSPPLLTASSTTTLYGEGVHDGVMVRMPNHGNQWAPQFPTPTIDVQIVKGTQTEVSMTADQVVRQLQQLLMERQDALHIEKSYQATLVASSSDPDIYYVAGSRTRALAALGLVGMIITMTGVYLTERALLARRAARAAKAARSRRSRVAVESPPGTADVSERVLAGS